MANDFDDFKDGQPIDETLGDADGFEEWKDGEPLIEPTDLSGTNPPEKATSPDPANNQANVATDKTLSWSDGGNADSFDVYFGTSSPGTFQGNQAGTNFDPGTLDPEQTYFWRIDSKNTNGTTTGDVWQFTTRAAGAAGNQPIIFIVT
jgi:hypothetical protein